LTIVQICEKGKKNSPGRNIKIHLVVFADLTVLLSEEGQWFRQCTVNILTVAKNIRMALVATFSDSESCETIPAFRGLI